MKKYYGHKLEKIVKIEKVVTIHYFEFDKNFRSKTESHNFWELVYADKSNIVCSAEDKNIVLRQGEMLFHKPNERHSLSSDGTRAPNVFIISFECKSAAMSFFENRKLKLNKKFEKYIYAIVEEMKKTFDVPYSHPDLKKMNLLSSPSLGGQQLIENYLEILLINIMREVSETESKNEIFLQKNVFEKKLVCDILHILDEHINGDLSIDDICRLTSYGRAHVFREFKAATGKGVMEYFVNLKIERAKKLLRESEMSVKEISDSLSFDTPNYFSKTFRRLTGITPTAYKKRNGEL